MPLEESIPQLDTRKYADIYQDALLRIPRYLPDWTDYNDSDPGITLVQLFAWFTETINFQLNQVPERTYLKFLQMLNMELRPARPATAYLTFTATATFASVPVAPQYTQVEGQPAEGDDPLIFETETGLDLIRSPLEKVIVYDGARYRDFTEANDENGVTFRPLGWMPQEGNALYLGFGVATPSLAPPIFPQQMRLRLFLPERQPNRRANCGDESATTPEPPVKLRWEYRSTRDQTRWWRLDTHLDETAGFTREGFILVAGPPDIVATKEVGQNDKDRYWLRCRLDQGAYPGGQEPEIDRIKPNVVAAKNLATVREEIVSTREGEVESSGRPNQIFRLRQRPVLPGSLKLKVLSTEGEERWCEVEDLLGSSADDPHFTFNANTGEIRFGDGENGRIPVAGAQVVADSYRYGGGARGNVPFDNITGLAPLDGIESVTNERPAVGGFNEQTIEELKRQAPGLLRSRRRAVTAEDFVALALQAGGVVKAKAIALHHPDFAEEVKVPGAITVIIVPDTTDQPPVPSADQIQSVCRHLNDYRLLTTELYVISPRYRTIRVEATVTANPYAAFDQVAQNVRAELNKYLDPRPRLPAVNPWPDWDFGADFHPTNLFAVMLKAPDVVNVKSLALFVDGIPYEQLGKPVRLGKTEIVYGVADHEIVVVPNQDS